MTEHAKTANSDQETNERTNIKQVMKIVQISSLITYQAAYTYYNLLASLALLITFFFSCCYQVDPFPVVSLVLLNRSKF